MIGIIDTGGSFRAAFADGVLDFLQDQNITVDYFIGVSAGAANGASFIARQRGRNFDFYTKYNLSPKAVGPLAWLKTRGSLVDLDYIYGTLSNSSGKAPLDYPALMASPIQFKITATSVETGEAVYFDKQDMKQDDYRVISASSCTPLFCKPYKIGTDSYFDGYVADPIPVEKAIHDGCSKLVILLTLPKDHMRSSHSFQAQAAKVKKYPVISQKLSKGAEIYNRKLEQCLAMEKEGNAIILFPEKNHIGVFERDRQKITALYEEGLEAGKHAAEFILTS